MFELAATHHHPQAIYELGLLWDDSKSIRHSGIVDGPCPVRAAEYYRRSASLGDARAQANLAACCANGDGINQNIKVALEMYSLAAIQNEPAGCHGLARCLEEGDGITVDLGQAAE